MSTFEEEQQLATPDWLGADGRAIARVLGAERDDGLAALKAAVKARWPAFGSGSAVTEQGHDRALERAPIETELQYKARLERVWDIWTWAGTAQAIRDIFAVYGYDDTTLNVLPRHQCDALLGVPVAPEFAWSSEFIIVLGPGYFELTSDVWSSDPGDNWDATSLWGVEGTPADVAWLRRQIRRMKSPQSYPVAVSLYAAVDFWGDPGVYDDGGYWGEVGGSVVWELWPIWGASAFGLGDDGVWSLDDGTWYAELEARLPRPKGG